MQTGNLTHVDLFTGIAGFALAAKWAGFRTVAFCEKDEWCQKVIRRHWPEVPIHGDVGSFPGHLYRGSTLLTGGFPCQPFSQTGKLRGVNDDRYLWPQMLEVIKDVRPNWVVCENVSGIVKMALSIVVADLEAEGFQCVVLLLPAHGVGAPHRRRRAFVVAQSLDPYSNGFRPYREEMHEGRQGGSLELRHEQIGIPGSLVPEQVWKTIDPRVFGVADGVPDRLDEPERRRRLQAVGNAVVPQLVFELLDIIRRIECGIG